MNKKTLKKRPKKKLTKTLSKPTGDTVVGRWIDRHCDCGCRLRTDGRVVWCSGVKCRYIERGKR